MALEFLNRIEDYNDELIVNSAKVIEYSIKENKQSFESLLECEEPYERIKFCEIRDIEKPEILYDSEVIDSISDYLSSLYNLRFESWIELGGSERLGILNDIEHEIAHIEHRPPLTVYTENMPLATLGYQDWDNKRIVLNENFILSNEKSKYKELLNTVIHEGRHAYQYYNVEEKLIHESWAEVNTWKENYFDPTYAYYHSTGQMVLIPTIEGYKSIPDFRLYYYQPVEIDARNFASDIMQRLEDKGVV